MSDTSADAQARAELRATLGQFATGVTIITAREASGEPFGMTANSFTSVSLEPPMILWNLGRDANCYRRMCEAERFAINFLAHDQRDLSDRFAAKGGEKFAAIDWTNDENGAPLLSGCIAYLSCRVRELIDAGDHVIVLADVTAHAITTKSEPLVFYQGGYRALQGD